jgi:hypothetical protein
MEAVAVLLFPVLLDVTVTVLVFTPTLDEITIVFMVQLAPAANVAPDRLNVLEPCVAVTVPPPQL